MGRQGGRLPLAGHHTHKQPLHRPALWPRWGPETTHAATGQRGVELAACRCAGVPAGESSPSQAHKLSQNGMPGGPAVGGTPRMGSPTVGNTKERAQTFHARMLPLSFLLSCRTFCSTSRWLETDWRGRLTGQGSLVA